jgi:hypothetical protein
MPLLSSSFLVLRDLEAYKKHGDAEKQKDCCKEQRAVSEPEDEKKQ